MRSQSHEAEGKVFADPLKYFHVNLRISDEIRKPVKLKSMASVLAKVSLGSNGLAQVAFEVWIDTDLCAIAETRLARVHANDMAF